jgi:hypothetical protein
MKMVLDGEARLEKDARQVGVVYSTVSPSSATITQNLAVNQVIKMKLKMERWE